MQGFIEVEVFKSKIEEGNKQEYNLALLNVAEVRAVCNTFSSCGYNEIMFERSFYKTREGFGILKKKIAAAMEGGSGGISKS